MVKTSEQQLEMKKLLAQLPSLEMEVKSRTEDCDMLRAKLEEAETENRQYGEKMQSLEICSGAGKAGEATLGSEINQLQSCLQDAGEQIMFLERKNQQVKECPDQTTTKVRDFHLSEAL